MYTTEEQLKAAYALNLCKVSISQIVDYNDINILEQEYENILNNLNLEQMPKDDTLLDTLNKILDTITYFRISEGDKKMIDAEYQHKMKNAVWSAIPRMGMIFASGNPVAMALTLAAQVGVGYMNYRRNRAEYQFGKDEKTWQLQRSAIDQLNGLQKQLFTTAWKLSDEYKFPDEFRLTEDQIQEYNAILIEPDAHKRYTRLEMIQDKFAAYPQFWYQIGSTANSICHDPRLDHEMSNEYRERALNYFEQYRQLNRFNLLRNDVFTSAWALEYIDLLDLREPGNLEKAKELAATAEKYAGNAMDVLELCAYAQLKLGDFEKAARLFKLLVAKDYNTEITARILSGIYIQKLRNGSDEARNEYRKLSLLTDQRYMLPLPEPGEDWTPEWAEKNAPDDPTPETPELSEITISSIQHIAPDETRTYRNQIIHFQARVNCEGTLEFDSCVLHYNESENADEISLTGTASLTMRKCTVINHGYDEHFFLETKSGEKELLFENCEFISCCYFLSSSRNVNFIQCKMVDIGDNFLSCPYHATVLKECEFLFLQRPVFFPEHNQRDLISCDTAKVSQCVLKGPFQISTPEATEEFLSTRKLGDSLHVFLYMKQGFITNSSFAGFNRVLSVGDYENKVLISQSVFEHCAECLFANTISGVVVKITDCRFDHCSEICMNLVKGSQIQNCQFNDCVSKLFKTGYYGGVKFSFCEFNNWQASKEIESDSFFAGKMLEFHRVKGKSGMESLVKDCSFNGMLAHTFFLIGGRAVEQISGPAVRVESCSFQNCVSERSTKKLIREYDIYFGMFKKEKEQRVVSISDCRGLDKVNMSGSRAENVVKKDKNSTGEIIGATVALAIAGVPGIAAVTGMATVKAVQCALKDDEFHNE